MSSTHASYVPCRAVRTRRWKYIRNYTPLENRDFGGDPGPARDLWDSLGGPSRFEADEQLYDLMYDPGEACNLAQDPEYADRLSEMQDLLTTWQNDTGDPILDGEIPPVSPDGLAGYLPEKD